MKRIFTALLAAVLCLGLAACAADEKEAPGKAEEERPAEPLAAAEPASPPEPEETPDYALFISEQPVPAVEGCIVTDRLPVTFINNTGKDGYVLDIPRLERQGEDGMWTEVPYQEGLGFCGTPSTLPAGGREWSEDISMLWGSLEDGRYRLSYPVGASFETEDTAYGEFTLYTPEDKQGLPLAPQ